MTDYLPKFYSDPPITRKASAVIDGGQVVVVTGPGQVGPSAGANASWVGVASHPAAIGDDVTIFKGGVQRPLAASAIVAGDQVVSAANGRVATLAVAAGATAADINSARQVIGTALTSQASAGQPVEVDFLR